MDEVAYSKEAMAVVIEKYLSMSRSMKNDGLKAYK